MAGRSNVARANAGPATPEDASPAGRALSAEMTGATWSSGSGMTRQPRTGTPLTVTGPMSPFGSPMRGP